MQLGFEETKLDMLQVRTGSDYVSVGGLAPQFVIQV
jgi:hypothetical protein